ncbi:MAG: DUF5916 domain-containing protein [Kofleriaceae bacterium]
MRASLFMMLALASFVAESSVPTLAEAKPQRRAPTLKTAKAAKLAKAKRLKAAKLAKAQRARLARRKRQNKGGKPIETAVATRTDDLPTAKQFPSPTVVAAHFAALEDQHPWDAYYALRLPDPKGDPNAAPLPTDGSVTDQVVTTLKDGTPLFRRRTKAARRKQDIKIDGIPDEAAWLAAPTTVMDWQQRPAENTRATGSTTFRILYDDDAIYLAADMFDPEPQKIAAILWRMVGFRKSDQSDWIIAVLAPSADRSVGYGFGITPAGVKGDFRISRTAPADETYNGIWDAQIHRNESGWTAEYRIPYSQMRVSSVDKWGFQLHRKYGRNLERNYWSPYPATYKQEVTAMGDLEFSDPINAGRGIEILPYVLGGARLERIGRTDTLHDTADPQYSLGADLKLALTSSLKLTASVNPDFGQIEADPSEVNLTDRETFFSERRPLFIEDADLYQFPIGKLNENLFYTRRIGARPHFSQLGAGTQYVDESDATTIYGAAKLSGTLGGLKLGLLSALAAEESSRAQLATGEIQDAVVEPLTSYNVLQLGRSFRGGASDLRITGTGVHRFLSGTMIDRLHENAYTGAGQYTHQFGNAQYSAIVLGGGSRVEGDAAALQITQRASQRYFQRPDADHVELDPMRTSLDGYMFGAQLGKIAGTWRGYVGIDGRSPGFETNDVGFLLDSDFLNTSANVAYEVISKGGPTKSVLLSLTGQSIADFSPELLRHVGQFDFESRLRTDWLIGSNLLFTKQVLDTKLLRGGPAVAGVDTAEARIFVETDPKKTASVRLDAGFLTRPESSSWRASAGLGLTWDVLPNLELNLTPSIVVTREDSQFVGAAADGAGTMHYVLGRLDQKTLLARMRLNYTITPRMSLQAYGEPFLSAGDYSRFKEAAAVRSSSYEDRFTELDASRITDAMGQLQIDSDGDGMADIAVRRPNFQLGTLLTNLVFRWDFRPGSAAYLIWSQSREGVESDGVIDDGDLGNVFTSHGAHVVLVKFSWWANL